MNKIILAKKIGSAHNLISLVRDHMDTRSGFTYNSQEIDYLLNLLNQATINCASALDDLAKEEDD